MSGHPLLRRYLPRHMTMSRKCKVNRNGTTTRHLRKTYHNACHRRPLRTRTSANGLTRRSTNHLLMPRPHLKARAADLHPTDGRGTPGTVQTCSRNRAHEVRSFQQVYCRQEQRAHRPLLTRYAGRSVLYPASRQWLSRIHPYLALAQIPETHHIPHYPA
jgi:hypothetical protein